MDTHQQIEVIAKQLRDIYHNTNEGPRLIAEMVEREFPKVTSIVCDCDKIDELETELDEVESKLRDAKAEISELEDNLSEAEARIKELERDEED